MHTPAPAALRFRTFATEPEKKAPEYGKDKDQPLGKSVVKEEDRPDAETVRRIPTTKEKLKPRTLILHLCICLNVESTEK